MGCQNHLGGKNIPLNEQALLELGFTKKKSAISEWFNKVFNRETAETLRAYIANEEPRRPKQATPMTKIRCYPSGNLVDLVDPDPATICIEDIAHALSHLCRFTGHVKRFMSVAEHSCNVAADLPKEVRLAGLLHDSAEAYLGDVSTPLKALLPAYREMEHKILRTIEKALGADIERHMKTVKESDEFMFSMESSYLTKQSDEWKEELAIDLGWEPWYAREKFLGMFRELKVDK